MAGGGVAAIAVNFWAITAPARRLARSRHILRGSMQPDILLRSMQQQRLLDKRGRGRIAASMNRELAQIAATPVSLLFLP